MSGRVRRACRWSLIYGRGWFCKLPALRDPGRAPMAPLSDDGCPKNCPDIDIVPWKKDLFGEEHDGTDDENGRTAARILEWSDEP